MKTYRVLSGGRESTSADALPAATQPATFLRMAGKETSLGLRQVAELKKVEEKLRERLKSLWKNRYRY